MFRVETDHFWFVGTRRVIVDCLERALGDSLEGAFVLDVGCGTGFTLTQLPDGVRALGLDCSPTALEYAQRRGTSAGLLQGMAGDLPVGTGGCDAVLALDVLEHLDDDRAAAAEIARVLRPGGVAVITVPAYRFLWSSHDETLEHKRRYRLPEITEVLRDTGLQVEFASYYNTWLFPLVAAVRLSEKLLGRDAGEEMKVPAAPVNAALGAVLASERHVLRHARFPFGVSCVVVARK